MKVPDCLTSPRKFLDFLIDRVAMFAAIIVSLGTVTLTFVIITPDILIYRVIMGTMGAILVLFSPRALAKRKFGLWRWIAVLIIFAEVSTVLTMTDTQSHDATGPVKTDTVLEHLQGATKKAQDNLTKLIDQQATAQTRATLDALADQIKTATELLRQATDRETRYVPAGSTSVGGIDPLKLFMAIPVAIVGTSDMAPMDRFSRWMTLIFALIVAIV